MSHARPLALIALMMLGAAAVRSEALGVLTPDVAEHYLVHTYVPLGAFLGSTAVRQSRSQQRLEDWARRDDFDSGAQLARHLQGALATPERVVIDVAVPRQARRGSGRLSRDQLPRNGRADRYLALTAHYVGLATTTEATSYQRALAVSDRWISAEATLIQHSRIVHYNRPIPFPQPLQSGDAASLAKRSVHFIPVADGCAFRTFEAVERETLRLWDCLDRAAAAVAAEIAKDVPAEGSRGGDLRSERTADCGRR